MAPGRATSLEIHMPEKQTLERARIDKRAGKAASTQAGEFVREEMDHIREGKHGARSTKQALKREGRAAASPTALAKQARSAAGRRSRSQRSASARRAVRTKGPAERSAAARKAARTREMHSHA
jgi:hypothetical protein